MTNKEIDDIRKLCDQVMAMTAKIGKLSGKHRYWEILPKLSAKRFDKMMNSLYEATVEAEQIRYLR